MLCNSQEGSVLVLATFRQRAAALLLDALILCTLATATWSVAAMSGILSAQAWIEGNARQAIFTNRTIEVTVLAVGAYYLLFEWLAGATPGKMLCRMRVKSLGKPGCDFVGALVRTALRPVDLITGAGLTVISAGRQRLGDRVGNTTVVLWQGDVSTNAQKKWVLATWEERTKAAIVDLALLSAVIGTCVSVFGPSANLAVVLAQFVLWYFILMTGWLGATVGKLASHLRVEPLGSSPSFATATLRAFAYPMNLVSVGILPLVLICFTNKRQSVTDWAANCVVVHSEPKSKGAGEREQQPQAA